MRRRTVRIVGLSLLCAAVIVGCGEKQKDAKDAVKIEATEEKESKKREPDVDLTQLSATMIYSEVYNMMTTPKEYIGKKVRMEGLFGYAYDESKDKYFFACVIQDATACCAQGIEFELQGDYTYPEDYPKEGETICVEGIFDTYEDGGNTYCTLRRAEFVQEE